MNFLDSERKNRLGQEISNSIKEMKGILDKSSPGSDNFVGDKNFNHSATCRPGKCAAI